MKPRLVLTLIVVLVSVALGSAQQPITDAPRVTRFATNPLVTVRSAVSLGANVNGPTVIRVAHSDGSTTGVSRPGSASM